MSVSNIIDPATGKIYDELIGQGGGVNLQKGQIITALANQTEVAFPDAPPADGSILSYDSTQTTGLRYIANPAGIALDYQELISADNTNNTSIVPAPLHDNYVLTSANTGAGNAGLAWKAIGGSGVITTNAPLDDSEPVAGTNLLSINFSANVGEIPYGNGTAKTGALTNTFTSGTQFLGVSGGVPAWKDLGGSGTITGTAPIFEEAGAGTNVSNLYLNFTATKGEIPAGNGTAKTGQMVPAPTQQNYVLTSDITTPTNPTGLAWKAVGGSGIITGVFPIVDAEPQVGTSQISIGYTAKGDLPVGTGVDAGEGVILPIGTEGQILSVYPTNTSGLRWIDNTPSSGGNVKVNRGGLATQEIDAPANKNDTMFLVGEELGASWVQLANPASGSKVVPYIAETPLITLTNGNVYMVQNSDWDGKNASYLVKITSPYTTEPILRFYAPIGWNTQVLTTLVSGNTIIFGGRFTNVEIVATKVGVNAYNVVSFTDTPAISLSQLSPTNAGLAYSTQIQQFGSCVSQIIAQGTKLWLFGSFDALLDLNNQPTAGYGNIISLETATNTWITPAQVATQNLKAYTTASFGTINVAYWNAGFTKLFVGGNFTLVGAGTALVAWGTYNTASVGTEWAGSVPLPNVVSVNSGAVSSNPSYANTYIVMGQNSTTGTGFITYVNLATNALTQIAFSQPLTAGAYGGPNCITSGLIIPAVGQPAVQMDAVLFYTGNNDTAYIYYITNASGTTAIFLDSTNPPYASNYAYGLRAITANAVLSLQVGGTDAIYRFDASLKPEIAFTLPAGSKFIEANALFDTATFASPANESQSFVASGNALNWIVVGAKTAGLTFS
jgi:hypothetical protein